MVKTISLPENKDLLMCGDNLRSLQSLPDACVDLCYIDPPFFTQQEWNAWGKGGELFAFKDRWKKMDEYLEFMRFRVVEIHRVLKDTGSFYLHCDWHASHYLKVTCDEVFGYENFRNEVVWKFKYGGRGKDSFGKKHDVILFYARSDKTIFNNKAVRVPHEPESLKQHFRYTDEQGRRFRNEVGSNGRKYKYFADEGRTCDDVWDDIGSLNSMSKERVGYPTQKPVELLERIIKASSNEGDIVLDAFAGSGSTCLAAHKLGRRYIGMELLPWGIRTIERRIAEHYGETEDQYAVFAGKNAPKIIGMPKTVTDLANMSEERFLRFVREETNLPPANLPNSCFRAKFGEDYVKIVQPTENKTAASIQDLTDIMSEMNEKMIPNAYVLALDFTEAFLQKIEKVAEIYGMNITPLLLGNPREIEGQKVAGLSVLTHGKPKVDVEISKGQAVATASDPDGGNITAYWWYLDGVLVDTDYPAQRKSKAEQKDTNTSVLSDKKINKASRLRVVACDALGGEGERRITL